MGRRGDRGGGVEIKINKDVGKGHRVNNLCLLKNAFSLLLSFFFPPSYLSFFSLKEIYTSFNDNASLKSHRLSNQVWKISFPMLFRTVQETGRAT